MIVMKKRAVRQIRIRLIIIRIILLPLTSTGTGFLIVVNEGLCSCGTNYETVPLHYLIREEFKTNL